MGSAHELEAEEAQWAVSTDGDDVESESDGSLELGPARSQNGHGCADLSDEKEEMRHAHGDAPFEVLFDGDDDPMCPRNMSIARKWLLVIIVGLGSLCVTCASSIYTATYAQMNPEFGQSALVATVGLSTFVLGIALGPLFLGPLSEFYGRRPIYLASWAMFLIWLIPAAVAHNTATILTVRFIDGFAGSAFLSVAGGTVSDVFRRDQIQSPMTIISLSPFIGPSLGPLLGGFNPIKLREKARRLRKETGDDRWKAPSKRAAHPRTAWIAHLAPRTLFFVSIRMLLEN
ncbi:hypothetical protein O1611_g10047 [Lasiodiplodia mahajangana]|uniref:Uncharacterized protein n=1 Tax=Lasiodiplodia mahajangana TaxID=1108764 RepID=A0ACC2J2U4_9PEZI|nr:hypothetical protein O1611_g10047 [Lasiodiplodia mahajangana]